MFVLTLDVLSYTARIKYMRQSVNLELAIIIVKWQWKPHKNIGAE